MRDLTAVVCAALVITATVFAQTPAPMKPASPGTPGDPAWQGTVHLSDGRTFVTDGGLAVDAALAKPAAAPSREIAAKVLEGYLKAPHDRECGFADLTRAPAGKTYLSPAGVALNATYVDYLRRVAPRESRLRMTDGTHPIVVVAEGRPIAVLMPVKQ